MKSVMKHDFSQIPKADIPRSVFNRTHGHKTTFDAGELIPVYVDEVMPGDTFNAKATFFARMATPIYPLMDNLHMDVHFWHVPVRLVWENFKEFMGEQADPENPVSRSVPQIVAPAVTGWTEGSLADYFGIPTEVASLSHSSLWHRAYNLIWNEWYRCTYIQPKVVVDVDDGADSAADYVVLKRGKRHDYFTSALPWPQAGPAVELPLGDTADVKYGAAISGPDISDKFVEAYVTAGGISQFSNMTSVGGANAAANANSSAYPLYADLSSATASTINALRQAFQLQRLYERDARGGLRYTELIRAHFGVVSPDARLQRPEYLGGSTARVNLTSIAQTSKTDGAATLGTLGAIGTITCQAGFTKSFTEHGLLIGIVSVRADLTYQQGLPRMFSRLTRWDYYWPGLAHLGEQAIYQKEIFANGTPGDQNDDKVFGYQERWAEYRYFPSKITGMMRSNYATPLHAWHLSQEFAQAPTLSDTFIVENPPMSRVLSVSAPHFLMDSLIELRCARPMPTYSVPGLIDHF